jgi:hypothetical protein
LEIGRHWENQNPRARRPRPHMPPGPAGN